MNFSPDTYKRIERRQDKKSHKSLTENLPMPKIGTATLLILGFSAIWGLMVFAMILYTFLGVN